MLDKLFLKVNSTITNNNWEPLGHPTITQVPDQIYKKCLVLRRDKKHLLTIKTEPIWSHVSLSQIQLNPSNWESYERLKIDLESFVDTDLLTIARIDSAVDLNIPVSDLFQSVRIKYKQDLTKHSEHYKKGFLTGFYMGNQPEIFCIYDKGYQLNKKKFKRDNSFPTGELSRIEVRQTKHKVPVKEFKNLEDIINTNPFKNLQCLEVSEDNHNRGILIDILYQKGMANIYTQLNKHNNFKRDYKKWFIERDLNEEIFKKHKESLGHYFSKELLNE